MKDYLIDFLKEFEYEADDSKVLISLYDKIWENSEARKIFEGILSYYEKSDDFCYHDFIIEPMLKAGELVGAHPYTANLLIHICMSKKLRKLYSEREIDYEIYRNTILDLKWKLIECKLVKGIVGISTFKWFEGFFKLTIFSLGRLQFEILKAKCDYEKDGICLKKGQSNVINVHIPRTGAPLDKKSCDEAYSMARKFFKNITGEDLHFVCNSWLLFPENKNIIPQNTNIYRFMSEYDIVSFEYNLGEDLWRLFDTEEKNPSRLPTNTSLRWLYVQHLKNGGRVGTGIGIKI